MAWAPAEASWRIEVGDGPARVDATWRFTAVSEGWTEVRLVGPGLTVESLEGPVTAAPSGVVAVIPPGDGEVSLRVVGTMVPPGPGALALSVLPVPVQHVTVDAPGLDVTVEGALRGELGARDRLALTWAPHVDTVPTAPAALVRAEVATASWGQEGALEVRGAVRWQVLRGEASTFRVDVAGLQDVEATGPNVARAVREGDTLRVDAREPVRGAFAVRLSARRPLSPGQQLALPALTPLDVRRVERWVTLGRSDEGELVPVSAPRAVSSRALPDWARGLSEATPVAHWTGDAAVTVRAARYEPVAGPDTVVERAELHVATSREGRVLLRATWLLWNERSQYLHVRPPPGWKVLTVRVSGEPVLALDDGAGGLYVPLEKSLETVRGLLSFPVEVCFLAEGEAWEKRGERAFVLPAVDAPVREARWSLHLPRGYDAPEAETSAPVEVALETEGERSLQRAVTAYKHNDWAAAQSALDDARAQGLADENVDRLQSNLDVLTGPASGSTDSSARRVKELAKAKTSTVEVVQDQKREEADKALAAGDLERADQLYGEVAQLSTVLAATEQAESGEQAAVLEEANRARAEVSKRSAEKKAASSSFGSKRDVAKDEDEEPVVAFGPDAPIDFSGVDVEGSFEDGVEGGVAGGEIGVALGGAAGAVGGAPTAAPAPVQDVAAATPVIVERDYQSSETTVTTTRAAPARPKMGARVVAALPEAPPPPPPPPPAEAPAPAKPADAAARAPAAAQPARRAALVVEASAFTVALPSAGPVVTAEQALLPAGQAPTLTVRYRQAGDPR